jgi:hypothetical protein
MEKPRRVGDIYDIFVTEDMRFGFLARKPNLISSEFWGRKSIVVVNRVGFIIGGRAYHSGVSGVECRYREPRKPKI